MSTYDSHDHESTELDDRTERALTERMSILPEGGDLYTVVGENHPDREESTYTVDLRRGRCSCRDARHRDVTCKYQRRVLFATGAAPVPAEIGPADVPGELGGEHLKGGPRFLATDGGPRDDRTRVPVASGMLVHEEADLGRELVGAEEVTDWDALADGLAARGHGCGAVYHLKELDADRRTAVGRDSNMTGGHNDRYANMTDTNITDDDGRTEYGGNTDPTTDTEHHLGGVAAGVTGVEVLTVPESPGWFTVETLPADTHRRRRTAGCRRRRAPE